VLPGRLRGEELVGETATRPRLSIALVAPLRAFGVM
jgi:hypothetical protein